MLKTQKQRDFSLLYVALLGSAATNTALQSVLPAIGRSLGLADTLIAMSFSVSALIWTLSAPWWARRSDRQGRKRMIVNGTIAAGLSVLGCGLALSAGLVGWVSATAAFLLFVLARLIYGAFGSASPPAAQAYVATRTTAAQRTKALTLLASAFGLGTILGPALAPFFVLPVVGLAGPAYVFGIAILLLAAFVAWQLPDDDPRRKGRGAAAAEPSLGHQPSGASVIAATAKSGPARIRYTDPRVKPWLATGLIAGHAQAAIMQTTAFLVIDRLMLRPHEAQPMIGLVLMAGAGASLLGQWGIIPRFGLGPRALVLWGSLAAALGCGAIAFADDIHMISVAFALASLGFGLLRPGFTAGASLAVGPQEQGAVAGQVTAINGGVWVLGPSLGVGLYQFSAPLPYLLAAGVMLALIAYAMLRISRASPHAA